MPHPFQGSIFLKIDPFNSIELGLNPNSIELGLNQLTLDQGFVHSNDLIPNSKTMGGDKILPQEFLDMGLLWLLQMSRVTISTWIIEYVIVEFEMILTAPWQSRRSLFPTVKFGRTIVLTLAFLKGSWRPKLKSYQCTR